MKIRSSNQDRETKGRKMHLYYTKRDTFVRKQLETSGQYLEPGPYKAGSFFFVDICNKNLDTFGDNHYYAQMVDTMHSLIKVQGGKSNIPLRIG
ncbi:hypothetical protein F2Q70_00032662 [Brassica cretica]|uniref:Uncharacterized protein n=1 Tax=Brassica cretica TaxID=69181 RepID=A0A8S9FLA6_BRACR|nr:hypothetical protein F2Q70_00032662 [Brassica cretica]